MIIQNKQSNNKKDFIFPKEDSDFQFIQGQKYLWRLKKCDQSVVNSIAYDHNLSVPIAQTLYSRGFLKKEEIFSFLFTSFEKDVANPKLFKGAQQALQRIEQAIEKNEKILVFGDYDVDGITSTSLLMICLLPLGVNINFYLPNRKKDGYGLSSKFVKKAAENKYDLIITVDNGITANDAAKLAQKLGVDLIITDHHRPHGDLPPAIAIIDANQHDCLYPYKELAGVGIIFKIISMLYEKKNLSLSDKVYELLMLGTVADVAPLTSENRYWVQYGLNKVNKQKSIAIKVLAQNSKLIKKKFSSLDVGFMLAPQLNALGRLDDPRDAVKFLISSDVQEVNRIGENLRKINKERRRVDQRIYGEIERAILEKRINIDKENIIMAASEDWPAGVIGLVAGKLAQNFGRPTFLFHAAGKGILKGSCRSIPEFNVFDALQENSDLLIRFGGHSFAAGLQLKQENLHEFKKRLEQKIKKELTPFDLKLKINLDSCLDFSELKQQLISDLQRLEPFGNQNEQPAFFIKDVTLQKKPMLLKDRHVKCFVFAQGVIKPVIFFNRPELYSVLNQIGDKSFSLAAYVEKNEWEGKTNIELKGLDIAISD